MNKDTKIIANFKPSRKHNLQGFLKNIYLKRLCHR